MCRPDSVQSENGENRSIDAPLLLRAEMPGQISESIDVDGSHLLDEDSCFSALDLNLGSERCPASARRRGRDQNHRAGEERIRLNDHPEPLAMLFVADPFGQPEVENVTPTHEGSP